MKKILLLGLWCLWIGNGMARKSDTLETINIDTMAIKRSMAELDSMNMRINNMMAHRDSAAMARDIENMTRNTESFLREREEQEKKKLMGLWVRGGLFVAMIALVIVNFIRRRNNKKDNPPT